MILLPTDNCPECLQGPWHPWIVTGQDSGTGVEAHYTCLSCGHSWRTCWAREAVFLPCPGCPECPAPEGSEAAA